jgi:hypothetical protein
MELDTTAVSLLFCVGLKHGLYSELIIATVRFKLPNSPLQIFGALVGNHQSIPMSTLRERSGCV